WQTGDGDAETVELSKMMSDDAEHLLSVYDEQSDQSSLSLDETTTTKESPDDTSVKALNKTKPRRNRKSSRCGCQAYMRISKTTELGEHEWRVTGFSDHHNHQLLEPN
nr:protein FAR1-related sequence 11 [Tanacetum cinerariifolium]